MILGASAAVITIAVPTAAWLWFRAAPYGRHHSGGWGPLVGARLGWILMESPSVLLFAAVFARGAHADEPARRLLAATWLLHYVHRTFVFPFRLRNPRPMPWMIVGSGAFFNVVNASINAGWIGGYGSYSFAEPRLWVGIGVFLVGLAINVHADQVLLRLRAEGGGYKVPTGGLYRWVTCPNYLGEMVEWLGWAIATASLPGLAFFVFTVANLAPRARTHHRWYRERFPDYPAERRALVPWLF